MQFLTLVILARAVSVSDFGVYVSAIGIGAVVSGVTGFGLIGRSLLLGSESKDHLVPSLLITAGSLGALAGAVVFLFVLLRDATQGLAAAAAAAFIASEMISAICANLLLGEQRQSRATAVLLAQRAIPFIFVGAVFLLGLKLVFEAAAIGFALSAVVSLSIALRRGWFGFRTRELLSGSRQYWFASLWSMLQQLDVTIVSFALGTRDAAGYGAAFRLASPIHIVTGSLTSLLIPRVRGLSGRSERKSAAVPYLGIGLGYSIAILALAPVATWLGPTFFGPDYEPFAPLFGLFFANGAVSVLNQLQIALLYSENEPKFVARCTAIGTVSGLGLVTIGALLGGVVWAAIGYLISRVVLGIALQFAFRVAVNKTKGGSDNAG